MDWKIGCSGFAYNDWQGIFYPDDLPRSQWFDYYTRWFYVLELNVTFYRLPGLQFFKNLYKKSPADFSFVIKAPKAITHTQQFKNTEKLVEECYSVIKIGLAEKLAAALFQLPPSYHYSKENLQNVIDAMDDKFINVVEFRHKSWWNKEIIKELGDNNICFCGVSHPSLPDDVIINTATPYYRFHGVPKLYYSIYDESFLRNVADSLVKDKMTMMPFLLFNNTATRAALENATYMQEYVEL